MNQVAIDEQVKELAAEYTNQSLGRFFISDTGAERIARRHIEDGITLDDAIIEQCGRDVLFITLYRLPVTSMSNEELIAALDPYLPNDWNVLIHREKHQLCIPCATGQMCAECGEPTLQFWSVSGPLQPNIKEGAPRVLDILFGFAEPVKPGQPQKRAA